MNLSDELSRLSELRQSGTLTEEEFARAKARLLNSQEPQAAAPLTYSVNTFRRSRNDRWVAGVCGGIARATGVESWVWRLFFTVLLICGGAGLLVYFLLAIFVPSE
jgi:phage shock protein PspC (stress-responsive transcriptional regulator)